MFDVIVWLDIILSGLGRIAEPVVDRQQVSFFCLSKRKASKKKTSRVQISFYLNAHMQRALRNSRNAKHLMRSNIKYKDVLMS